MVDKSKGVTRILNDYQGMMEDILKLSMTMLINLDSLAHKRKLNSPNLTEPMIRVQVAINEAIDALDVVADQMMIASMRGDLSQFENCKRWRNRRKRRKSIEEQLETFKNKHPHLYSENILNQASGGE